MKASEECTATTEAKMAIIDVTAIMLFAVWTWNVDWRGVEDGDLAGTLLKLPNREFKKTSTV